jgi:hypothetical protein
MSDTSVHKLGNAAWRDALARIWGRHRKKTAAATTPPKRASDSQSALGGGWLVNRVACAVVGHRQLLATAAAEKVLPSGARRQLLMCHACGSYAWKTASKSYSSSWSELGV